MCRIPSPFDWIRHVNNNKNNKMPGFSSGFFSSSVNFFSSAKFRFDFRLRSLKTFVFFSARPINNEDPKETQFVFFFPFFPVVFHLLMADGRGKKREKGLVIYLRLYCSFCLVCHMDLFKRNRIALR